MSTVYHAPLADLEFLLGDVLDVRGLLTLPAFEHVDADGLLHVDVRPGLQRVDALQGVPVIGRSDEDDVELADDKAKFPYDLEPVKLESLRILADLINLTPATRTAQAGGR